MKFWIAVIIAVLVTLPVQARTSSRTVMGVVTYVSDGDTLWVKTVGDSEAWDVRIQGIDAPESCQAGGQAAKQALSHFALHQTVTLTTKARDKYGRMIAKVSMGNQDVGAWMVANGHAWSYHFHRSRGLYAQEEMFARQAGRGLWRDGNRAVEPREFRRRTKCHKPRK